MKWFTKRRGLAWQFGSLLVMSGILCGIFFAVMHFSIEEFLFQQINSPEFQEQATEKRITEFQTYVTANQLSTSDGAELAQWVRKNPLLLMEIYRYNVLIFTSSAPENQAVLANDTEAPYYEWMSYYVVEFADGNADVLLYSDDGYRYSTIATIFELMLCTLLFLGIFLHGCQKIVRYIQLISKEILAMESGDLDNAITVKGSNELSTLAQGLDSMRQAFRAQQEREARSFAANQALISEMSHDLRTPLTSLLIYTEVLRYGKYENQEQLLEYLDKIDDKAQQIKQLSENILEYSLQSKETVPELETPAPIEMVFEEPLSEMITELSRHGFMCDVEPFGEPVLIAVRGQYIRRIMDNILSNIQKYADKKQPVRIWPLESELTAGLIFENTVADVSSGSSGTQIGVKSIGSLMEKMGGSCQIENTDGKYRIALDFPKVEVEKLKEESIEPRG